MDSSPTGTAPFKLTPVKARDIIMEMHGLSRRPDGGSPAKADALMGKTSFLAA